MFGNELRKNAYEIIKDSYQDHKIDPEELLKFLERITDESLSSDLSYKLYQDGEYITLEAYFGIDSAYATET